MPSAKLGWIDPNRTGMDELTDEQAAEIADVPLKGQTTPRTWAERNDGCSTGMLILLAVALLIIIL